MIRRLLPLLLLLALPAVVFAGDPARTEAYDVSALLAGSPEPARDALGLVAWTSEIPLDPAARRESGASEGALPFVDEDLLVELVVTYAGEAFEAADEADVELVGSRLLVTGPPALQAAAQEILGVLWREASRRLEVTADHVRLDAPGMRLIEEAGLLDPLRGGRLTIAEYEALRRIAGQVGGLSSATGLVAPGRRTVLGRLEATPYVRDYSVEIAQDARVGNPQVDRVATGWLLDVRPHALQSGDAFVEILAQSARLTEPIRSLALEAEPFGAVDLPACEQWRHVTALRVPRGEAVATVALDGSGGLEAWLLRVEARGGTTRPGGVRRYDVGALTTPPTPWRLGEDADARPATGALQPLVFLRGEERESVIEEDTLVDRLSLAFGEEAWERDGTWILGAQGAILAANESMILDALGEALRVHESALETYRLRLSLLQGEGESQRLLAAVALDVPADRPVVWQAGVRRAYVADWDVEVAQESRVGDPQVGHVFAGLSLSLELDPAPMAGMAVLACDATWASLGKAFGIRRPRNECTGIIEIPDLERLVLTQDLVLEAGVTTRLDVGRAPDGTATVLEVRLGR